MVCLRHALDLHALAHHGADARRSACAGSADTSLPRHAADCSAQGHRLDGSTAVVCAVAAGGLAAQLWRLARLVALVRLPPCHGHYAHHARRLSATHDAPSQALHRTRHVDLSQCGARDTAHRCGGGALLVRACARNGVLRGGDALCRPHLRGAQPLVVAGHSGRMSVLDRLAQADAMERVQADSAGAGGFLYICRRILRACRLQHQHRTAAHTNPLARIQLRRSVHLVHVVSACHHVVRALLSGVVGVQRTAHVCRRTRWCGAARTWHEILCG